MASDGQGTEPSTGQPTKCTIDKIFQIGKSALWGGSGDVGATQEIKARIEMLGPSKQGQHNELRKNFTEIVHEVNEPRYRRFVSMPMPDRAPPVAKVLLVQYEGVTPRIVEIEVDGGATNHEGFGFQAIGSGDIFARQGLYGYEPHKLTLDQSKVLAYMTIQKAIDIAALGMGLPIDIWTLTKKGDVVTVDRIAPQERDVLRDTANVISKAQLEVFTGYRVAKI
jgi:20S proteasome alpha/beta subunit